MGGQQRRNNTTISGSAMKARVKWSEQVSFVVESGSGHAVVIDGDPEARGPQTSDSKGNKLFRGGGGGL